MGGTNTGVCTSLRKKTAIGTSSRSRLTMARVTLQPLYELAGGKHPWASRYLKCEVDRLCDSSDFLGLDFTRYGSAPPKGTRGDHRLSSLDPTSSSQQG